MGFSSADSSSASKGESVSDTIRTVSCYADIVAMRHPKEGAPMVACKHASIPVINAGDGGHQHPTQTLTDLLTIRSVKGRLDHMTIGLCGDLKFGRTVHSLIHALVRYEGIKFVLISPEELRLPSYIRQDVLDKNHIEYKEVVRLEDAMPELDILYMTRVQKERFFKRRRLCPHERFLYPGQKENAAGSFRYVCTASTATCQRDFCGSRSMIREQLISDRYSMVFMYVWH